MIHPHIVHRSGSLLKLSLDQIKVLQEDPRPILWVNDGLYAIVPVEVIRNELNYIENSKKADELMGYEVTVKYMIIHWAQANEIPASTGEAIEKYNGSKLETKQPNDGSE